jgi:hypothetical protein
MPAGGFVHRQKPFFFHSLSEWFSSLHKKGTCGFPQVPFAFVT